MAITTPKNKTEAEAMQKAMAVYNLARAEAVRQMLNSPEALAFEALLIQTVNDGLPGGTTTAGNVVQLPKWFVDVRGQADNDVASLNMTVNPPLPVAEGNGETAAV